MSNWQCLKTQLLSIGEEKLYFWGIEYFLEGIFLRKICQPETREGMSMVIPLHVNLNGCT